jgi:hypothetical protein
MPVGHLEWDQVTSDFNSKVSAKRAREKTSLQRKFNLMKDANVRTGNPIPPKTIMKAKEINEELIQKLNEQINADVGANGEYDVPGDDEGEDEEQEQVSNLGDDEGGSTESQKTSNTPAQNHIPVPRNLTGGGSYSSRKRANGERLT